MGIQAFGLCLAASGEGKRWSPALPLAASVIVLLAAVPAVMMANTGPTLRADGFPMPLKTGEGRIVETLRTAYGVISVVDTTGDYPMRQLYLNSRNLCSISTHENNLKTQSEWVIGDITARAASSQMTPGRQHRVAIIGLMRVHAGCRFEHRAG